jgi:hypothetical protein
MPSAVHIQAAALYESFISILALGRPATRPDGLAPAAARAFVSTEERAMSLLSPFRRHWQVDGSAGIGKGINGLRRSLAHLNERDPVGVTTRPG